MELIKNTMSAILYMYMSGNIATKLRQSGLIVGCVI